MAKFIIQTWHESPMRANGGYWADEPGGIFDTQSLAVAAVESLIDVCKYPAEDMRIVEIDD
jgi:hypothetical protein